MASEKCGGKNIAKSIKNMKLSLADSEASTINPIKYLGHTFQ